MSWIIFDTDEIISDDEFNEICTECVCFCSEGNLSLKCNGDRYSCPYIKKCD